MKYVSIINYGLGNIYSIQNAVSSFGYKSILVNSPAEVQSSSHIILPGVGSFQHAMNELKKDGLDEAILEFIKAGKPILGICLGMQLLFDESEENDLSKGLGVLKGKVLKFPSVEGYTIPQIQWNKVNFNNSCSLMSGISKEEFFYFLHSYYVKPSDLGNYAAGLSNYAGLDYVSLIESDNVTGVQFHPEKSAKAGLQLIENFTKR